MYDVIYHIPCFSDGFGLTCDLCYVGHTGLKRKIRKQQHIDDIIEFNITGELEGKTALVKHYYESGHVPDVDNMSLLDVEHNYTKKKILE